MQNGQPGFSRREREIMDALYRVGEGGAAEVVDQLGQRAAYDSIRVTLAVLERKGHLVHRQEGPRNIYRPVVPKKCARRIAMQHLIATFFDDSASDAVLDLLDQSADQLSPPEIDAIIRRLDGARARS